ncbi:MAG: transporter [Bacillus sp. (in: firmicutes)]|nr:transporter [Bacillus sp. (in: firmicutes)]
MTAFLYFIKKFHSYSGRVMVWNILGMGLISFFEGFGIFLLVPMLGFVGIVDINIGKTPLNKLFGILDMFPLKFGLPMILGSYILLIFFQNLIDQKLTIRNAKICQGFIGKMRLETYSSLLHANWGFYTKKRKSDLVNIMTIELARVAGGTYQFILLLSSIIFTSIQIFIAFLISVKMTLFVLISGLVLALFSRKFIKQSQNLGKKTSLLAQEYLAGITDQLNGIKDIKSNTLEDSRLTWLGTVVRGMFDEQIEYIKLKTNSQVFYKMASTILITVFIFFSVKIFNSQPGQFLLILVVFSRLWPRITGLQSSLEQLASTLPAFNALLDLQNESKEATEIKNEASYRNADSLKIIKGIECQNVSFRYNKNNLTYAVENINITIPANEMTAIVGRSGAGKSTIIDILMGLNQPEQGEVIVDNSPLSGGNLLSFRRIISYVPQDPFLFNASIKENLLMMEPKASEAMIWEALEKSAADDFVRRLPQGLNTMIGDRGIRLSGGERQRLVLARALLRKPSILVLDEATSALDTENEKRIQKVLEKLKGSMTIIVIAHRLSTIRNADQVIVLDKGKVIQSGGFSQLAKEKKGVFRNLLDKQYEVGL